MWTRAEPLNTAEVRQLQAARVCLDTHSGVVAVMPVHGTGDPERPWCYITFDPTGRCVVHLLTHGDVAEWARMIPVALYEDDDLEPEIDFIEAGPDLPLVTDWL